MYIKIRVLKVNRYSQSGTWQLDLIPVHRYDGDIQVLQYTRNSSSFVWDIFSDVGCNVSTNGFYCSSFLSFLRQEKG